MGCKLCTCDGLKIGDVVILKSGGPKMTVTATSANGVNCTWFCECESSGVYEGPTISQFAEKSLKKCD